MVPNIRQTPNSKLAASALIGDNLGMARKRRKEGRTEKGFGSLKRQGKGWHLTVKLHGKVYNHATGKTDLEDAKEERDRFIRDIKLAEAAKNTTNINGDSRKYPEEVVTIDELLDDYIDYMKNEKSARTQNSARIKSNCISASGRDALPVASPPMNFGLCAGICKPPGFIGFQRLTVGVHRVRQHGESESTPIFTGFLHALSVLRCSPPTSPGFRLLRPLRRPAVWLDAAGATSPPPSRWQGFCRSHGAIRRGPTSSNPQ